MGKEFLEKRWRCWDVAKQRLDVALVGLGLVESRQKAQALIMAGEVYVNGQKQLKAGAAVAEVVVKRNALITAAHELV